MNYTYKKILIEFFKPIKCVFEMIEIIKTIGGKSLGFDLTSTAGFFNISNFI